MRQPVACNLLLELDKELEAAYWKDARTINAYRTWDVFSIWYSLFGFLVASKTMAPALVQRQLLPTMWHIHVIIALNLGAASATMAVMLARPRAYAAHRHAIATANRLLRLVTVGLAVAAHGGAQHVALVATMAPRYGAPAPGLLPGLVRLMRTLLVTPLAYLTQGMWVIRMKVWLPLQLLTHILVCHFVWADVPCDSVAAPQDAVLVQAACKGTSHLHQLLLGSLFGQHFYGHSPPGSLDQLPGCGTAISASRTLHWYVWTAYGLLVLGGGFMGLEFRLKAAFVRRRLGRPLVYRPLALALGGQRALGGGKLPWLQYVLSWLLGVPTAAALLWFACLRLVPLLPHQPCQRLEPYVASTPDAAADVWSQDVGLMAAAYIYLQLLVVASVFLKLLSLLRG